MAIWDQLLKKVISPVVSESLREIQLKRTDVDINKMLAAQIVSPVTVSSRQTKSTVDRLLPKGVDATVLRDFATYYPILRACINYRKRQISQLEWDIAPRDVIVDKTKKKAAEEKAKELREFIKYPVGDKSMSFRIFVNKLLEDIMVLDGTAIYRRPNKGGGLYGYLPIDATTIEIALNPDGTLPAPPSTAYVQKINGEITAELSQDELIYSILNPRTNTPYGLSPVETLVLTVTTALKLTQYNLAYLTEGNVPEGFVELPKDVASNQEQLELWQRAWDAMFSGDPRFQRKIRFLPEGMEWHPIRKQEEMEYKRFEEWLLLQTCSVMEVAPQSIGFQFDRGKGATEAEWEIGKERGLYPTAIFLKEIFDLIVQDDLKENDYEFVWTNINPTNKKEEADVFGQLVKSGAVSVDEWRLGEGMEPIGLGHYIMTPVGPVMVKDFIEQSEAGVNPFIPNYKPGTPDAVPGANARNVQPNPSLGTAKPTKDKPTKVSDVKQKLSDMINEDAVEELKKWKKVASNDLKQGKTFRDFQTDVIDDRTQKLIKSGLQTINNKQELDELFNPFISQENNVIAAMLDLYEEVNSIVDYEAKQVEAN